MKRIAFVSFLVFIMIALVACSSNHPMQVIQENQTITQNTTSQNNTMNATQISQPVENTTSYVPPQPAPSILVTGNSSSIYLPMQPKTYGINGMQHTIQLISVTENADGCLISVDGTTQLINIDSTQTINGVNIHVLKVYALSGSMEINNQCEVMLY